MHLWDGTSGEHLRELPFFPGDVHQIQAVAVSPDDRVMAVLGNFYNGSRNVGAVKVFDTKSGEQIAVQRFQRVGTALKFSPDSRKLAVDIGHRFPGRNLSVSIQVIDARTGEFISELVPEQPQVTALAFSPSGDRLWSVNGHAKIREFKVASVGPPADLALPADRAAFAAISSSSGRLVTSHGLGGIQVWDLHNGRFLKEIGTTGPASGISALALSQDGTALAIGMESRTLSIHEVSSGRLVGEIRELGASVRSLAFSSDGKHLVSGLGDGTAMTWRMPELNR